MARARRRGFTLVEMMVAVAIGALSIGIAVQIAGAIVKQAAKGRQRNDFSSRARLLGRQLRADLRAAGLGATGAIAVDPGSGPLGTMSFQTAAGFRAIPAVVGASGLRPGTLPFFDLSDALQLVVPNPRTVQRTYERGTANGSVIPFFPPLSNGTTFADCPMIYISDHSAPAGAGRAQIAFVANAAPTQVIIDGVLQFTVAPGSDVMCARISSYWVDDNAVLHRNDITRAGAVIQPDPRYPLYINTNAVNDIVAPGVVDMQIAFRVSSELYRTRNLPPPLDPRGQWVFEGNPLNPDAMMQGAVSYPSWFEVRMVRLHLLGRTLREINSTGVANARGYARREDTTGRPDIPIRRGFDAEWLTTEEGVTNLRLFDFGAPERVPAEPY